MATLEQKIIDELKLALEYQEPTGDYAQWLDIRCLSLNLFNLTY